MRVGRRRNNGGRREERHRMSSYTNTQADTRAPRVWGGAMCTCMCGPGFPTRRHLHEKIQRRRESALLSTLGTEVSTRSTVLTVYIHLTHLNRALVVPQPTDWFL